MDCFKKMKQGKIEERNEKRSHFEDLHNSSKRIMLSAYSINEEYISANLTIYVLEFYKKISIGKGKD